jgi:hypothetical protein
MLASVKKKEASFTQTPTPYPTLFIVIPTRVLDMVSTNPLAIEESGNDVSVWRRDINDGVS